MHNHINRVPMYSNKLDAFYLILFVRLTRICPAFNGVTIAIQRSMAIATTIYVDERIEKLWKNLAIRPRKDKTRFSFVQFERDSITYTGDH